MANINADTVDRYLQAQHYQLWSIYSIIDPMQRAAAAQWFISELNNVIRFAEAEYEQLVRSSGPELPEGSGGDVPHGTGGTGQ